MNVISGADNFGQSTLTVCLTYALFSVYSNRAVTFPYKRSALYFKVISSSGGGGGGEGLINISPHPSPSKVW